MNEIKSLKDAIHTAINQGTEAVETLHKSIAGAPWAAFSSIETLAPASNKAKELQDKTIGTVYSFIRQVNQTVGDCMDKVTEGFVGKPKNDAQ